MEIERINHYQDARFSTKVLNQHGCFLIDQIPYEVEIISDFEAVIHSRSSLYFDELIEEFRFYTPHIWKFYDEQKRVIKKYKPLKRIQISLKDIQPSQFFVDQEKVKAISTFIFKPEDIIIQVLADGQRFIALDGHTRLYYAAILGFTHVFAVMSESDPSIHDFVKEAIRRNIFSPYDLELLDHDAYEIKWNAYCDEYFKSLESF